MFLQRFEQLLSIMLGVNDNVSSANSANFSVFPFSASFFLAENSKLFAESELQELQLFADGWVGTVCSNCQEVLDLKKICVQKRFCQASKWTWDAVSKKLGMDSASFQPYPSSGDLGRGKREHDAQKIYLCRDCHKICFQVFVFNLGDPWL